MKTLSLLLFVGFVHSEVVHTKLGSIEGSELKSRDGRPYLVFNKIPYAKPPVGPLRFMSPEPHGPWEGTIRAQQPMPFCPQSNPFDHAAIFGQEDCLYLAVHKPKIDAKKLPVLVYVHGGAFLLGHPGPPELAGPLMDEDVILVTLTYRLGALGFMSLNDTKLPGNFGLKDQVAAISWIHDNIEAFGGDSEKITVVGESAGGASVHFLLLMPGSREKLQSAYAISGTAGKTCITTPPKIIKADSEKIVRYVGCEDGSLDEIMACLREVEDPAEFVKALGTISPSIVDSLFIGPTIEPPGPGAVVTEDFTKIKTTKPMVISFSAGEYLLSETVMLKPGTEAARAKAISRDPVGYARLWLKDRVSDKILESSSQKLKERYLKHDENSVSEVIHDAAMIFQDACFIFPAMDLADTHPGPKWVYQLVHRGEVSLADLREKTNTSIACHADDINFYFNQRWRYPAADPTENEADIKVSKELVKYLVNFATYGDPTPEGSPMKWNQYKSSEILRVQSGGSVMADSEFVREHKDILKFWRGLLDDSHIKEEL